MKRKVEDYIFPNLRKIMSVDICTIWNNYYIEVFLKFLYNLGKMGVEGALSSGENNVVKLILKKPSPYSRDICKSDHCELKRENIISLMAKITVMVTTVYESKYSAFLYLKYI